MSSFLVEWEASHTSSDKSGVAVFRLGTSDYTINLPSSTTCQWVDQMLKDAYASGKKDGEVCLRKRLMGVMYDNG